MKKADITNIPCYDEIPITKIKMPTLTCPCYKLIFFFLVINKLLSENERSLTNVHGTSLDYKSNSTRAMNETWKNKAATSTFNDASIANTPNTLTSKSPLS